MYNTNNPVEPNGSTDPRDISDNAQVLDLLLNSDQIEVTGRRGKKLKGIAALQSIITSLDLGSFTFADTASGLAGTNSGQYFRVPQGSDSSLSFIYYKNDNGSATEVARLAGRSEIEAISSLIHTKDTSQSLVSFEDDDGLSILEVKNNNYGIELSSPSFKVNSAEVENQAMKISQGSDLLSVTDEDGFTRELSQGLSPDVEVGVGNDLLSVTDEDGFTYAFDTGEKSNNNNEDVNELSLESLLKMSSFNQPLNHPVARIKKGLNIFVTFGQSLAVGAQSYTNVTRNPSARGNLMLGQSLRGLYFQKESSQSFGSIGGNKYNSLSEVIQDNTGSILTDVSGVSPTSYFGETIMSGFLESLKDLHNRSVGEDNDDSVIFSASCIGAAGATIEQLSKGNSAGWYNRFTTCLQAHMDAAKDAGYEKVQLAGIIFMQGENNSNQSSVTYSDYLSKLTTLHTNLVKDSISITGQTDAPAFFVYQTSGVYVGNGQSNTLPVANAQVDFVESNPGVYWVSPEFPYPNPGAHMYANSYRWFGCLMAKYAYRVLSGINTETFKVNDAIYDGESIFVSINTPSPPLKKVGFYLPNTPDEKYFDDFGFTVKDGQGELYGDSISVGILRGNVVRITPSRILSGDILLNLGDYHHNGGHNIGDSDGQVSLFSWEYYGDKGQNPRENISSLLNNKYALFGRCSLYSLSVRKVN